MVQDRLEALGPLYAQIGGELAHIVGNADGTFLYAEAGDGWLGYGVFKEEGQAVRYYRPTSELGDLIREAWTAEEPAKRWSVMEFQIKGTSFDARFQFREQIDPKSFEVDRRDAAVRQRFGDKPFIYPPPPAEGATR